MAFLRVFVPFAHRKLQFIDCFNQVRLAAHATETKAPEGTLKQSILLMDTAFPNLRWKPICYWSIALIRGHGSCSVINTFCDWLLLLCKAPAWTAQAKKIAGLFKFVRYVTTQNRYQCYILWLRIMLQVYNSSLFRSSSWFAVEKSRSHRHGRISFIVYPFPLWSRTKPSKRHSFVIGLSIFFSMTTNWLPQK